MVQIQNLNKIINFLRKSLRNRKINSTFALANGKLGYGVMVTLQILVLSFQVRILVAQQGSLSVLRGFLLCISTVSPSDYIQHKKGYPTIGITFFFWYSEKKLRPRQ